MNCSACHGYIPASSRAAACPFCQQPLTAVNNPPTNNPAPAVTPKPAPPTPSPTPPAYKPAPTPPPAASPTPTSSDHPNQQPPPAMPATPPPPPAAAPLPGPTPTASNPPAAANHQLWPAFLQWRQRHPFLAIVLGLLALVIAIQCTARLAAEIEKNLQPTDEDFIASVQPAIVNLHAPDNSLFSGFGYLVDKDETGSAFIYTDSRNLSENTARRLEAETHDGRRYPLEVLSRIPDQVGITKIQCPDCAVIPFAENPGEVVDDLSLYDKILAVAQFDDQPGLQVIHTHIVELERTDHGGISFSTAEPNFELPLRPSVTMSPEGKAFGVLFTTRNTYRGTAAIFEYTSQQEVKETIEQAGGYR